MNREQENIKLMIAYNGHNYLGWQDSKNGRSIEQTLSQAIEQILQYKISLQAASRTDKGVHAEGQVVNFFTEKFIPSLPQFVYSLNALLPKEIRVLQGEKVSLAFHPTLDAAGKRYTYFLCNSPHQLPKYIQHSWHIPKPLDLSSMDLAAKQLVGTHDFRAFCNIDINCKREHTKRTLTDISISKLPENRYCIAVCGTHFLYKMVRTIVGTLVEVGLGEKTPHDIKAILDSKKRSQAGITAPAHGLFLTDVFYSPKSSNRERSVA